MGITQKAANELGDIVHIDLPSEGTDFIILDVIICVESVKTAADVYQMVDGEVLSVNELVEENASLVNEDAENKGWLVKVKLRDLN